jgi:CRISPR-associated protein Cas1
MVSWVGEDSMLFYAVGQSPNSDSRNMRKQMQFAADPGKAVDIARRMFAKRFPEADLIGKNLKEMMGMEGYRVRQVYEAFAEKYGVGWKGRSYQPGKFEMGDTTNRYLTTANAALYGILTSAIYSMGYSPHIGFIHSGSPLPFVYDMADLYKEFYAIDLAFFLTVETAGIYVKEKISGEFRKRVIENELLSQIPADINEILKDF